MPCRDYDYDSYGRACPDDIQERLDTATRVACELARIVTGDYDGATSPLSEEAQNWIEAHRADDERRELEERIDDLEKEQESLIAAAQTVGEAWKITGVKNLLGHYEKIHSRIGELDCLIDDLRLKLNR